MIRPTSNRSHRRHGAHLRTTPVFAMSPSSIRGTAGQSAIMASSCIRKTVAGIWSPQDSGVTCTLNSVCFVDAHFGWAAGGMAWPFLHDTSGVVLATRDGGATWQRIPVLLPALHKIRFVTDRQGWAIGCSSVMYPGGVFLTRDGGRSWQPASSGGADRPDCRRSLRRPQRRPWRLACSARYDHRRRLCPKAAGQCF